MIKITHIIIGLNVGGAELMLKRLVLSSHEKKEFHHSVISLTDIGIIGAELNSKGVPVYSLGMQSALSIPNILLKVRKLLRVLQPDVVQTWMYHADLLGGLAAKSVGIDNIIWNVRNTAIDDRGFVATSIAKICAKLSYIIPKKIIYVSRSALKSHIEFGYNDYISIVVFNGFDVDEFKHNPKIRNEYRRALGITDNDIIVGSVGRFSNSKDHTTFIESINMAVRTNPCIKGLLVGRDISLDNFDISEKDKKNFLVIGQRTDIANLYSSMDIFCLHSTSEGFPNVLGEAMSTGLPCVVTKAGDAEFILNDGQYTSNIRDIESVSKNLLRLANSNIETRKKIGIKNRKRVENNFEMNNIIEEYLSLYNLIVKK